ncbi:MAG: hypothetical protein JWN14_4579 [Chthonomonadales bacterium]|nr:hypothetical protein [Chthonomonadales bacterium]
MLRDPRGRALIVFTPLCAVIGAVVGLIVVPAYIHWDIIRQCGGHPFPLTMGREDVRMFTTILCCGGLLILGPGLIFASSVVRGRWGAAVVLGLSLLFPWSIIVLVALLMTPPDGLWYRCLVNAQAILSLPVINWGLALGLLNLLQRVRWFPMASSSRPSVP